MKLLKPGIFTIAMGLFIASCGNNSVSSTTSTDSSSSSSSSSSMSAVPASPAVPDTTNHPADGTNPSTSSAMDTATQTGK